MCFSNAALMFPKFVFNWKVQNIPKKFQPPSPEQKKSIYTPELGLKMKGVKGSKNTLRLKEYAQTILLDFERIKICEGDIRRTERAPSPA